MNKLTRADLWSPADYESQRDAFRAEVIAAKQHRRLSVGPFMTFVFENRLTVKFQIQEILRAENAQSESHIAEELTGFNTMLPDAGELSATLLIELQGTEENARRVLASLVGLANHIHLTVDGRRVPGICDGDRDDGNRISAVQYVRFAVNLDAAAFAKADVQLRIDHPNYGHVALLSPAAHASLAADLAG